MLTATVCPYCGKRVPTTALKGICPECMFKAGFATDAGELGPGGTVVHKAPAPAPAINELAPHFPQLEIVECLGRGGMGVVYKARQPGLDRFVALKILRRSRADGTPDPEFAERFQREARALARLNHPDIVAVYDYGEAGGYNYLLMEHVDGVTLRHLLQTQKLSPEEALAIVPKICGALQFAHDRGIVHRDIKPENILLDKQGQVKIADFGIAKIVGQSAPVSLTHERQIIGTPHYMAPEQVEKPATVDHRADIFSLGVVFYEMLTGELPLGKFQPPSSRMRGVAMDVRLDEVVLRALEKEPERRYQHASEVKSDVETISHTPANPGSALPSREVVNGRDQSERNARLEHLEARRRRMLWYGFLVSLIGFPIAIVLRLPYVAMLSIAGGVIGGFKLGLFERGAMRRLFGSFGNGSNQDRDPSESAPAVKDNSGSTPGARGPRVGIDPSNIARWLARILGMALLAFYGFFMVVEGVPPIASQPEGVQLNFVALALMLLGFVIGWKRDGTAALLIASGWTLWQASESRVAWNIFQTPLPIAALYAYSWWAAHGRRTRTLVSALTLFAIALACGRLFLPTNVFVRGTVTDELGLPVPGVELKLASGSSANPNSSPAARSGRDGRFTLYAGWYTPGRNVAIAAPGYETLVASLGPRPLGKRHLVQDFKLQPIWGPEHSFSFETFLSAKPVDLDTGRLIEPPATRSLKERDQFAWLAANGADAATGGVRGGFGLVTPLANELKLVRLDQSDWAAVTAPDVKNALEASLSGLEETVDSADGWKAFLFPTNAQSHVLVAFQTAQGSRGLLEVAAEFTRRDGRWSRAASLRFKTLGQHPSDNAILPKAIAPVASVEASVPPVVISTIPASGSTGVDPALTELQVTFSKPMKAAAWDRENYPDLTGPPRLSDDERTCALPVKLDAGKVYAFWINSESAQPFKDTQGRAAVPYLLIFETRK